MATLRVVLVSSLKVNVNCLLFGLTVHCQLLYVCMSANHPYLQPEGWITKGAAQRDRRKAFERCLWLPPTVVNDPGAQQPSQMFLTWARPQHRELRALLLTNSVWVL